MTTRDQTDERRTDRRTLTLQAPGSFAILLALLGALLIQGTSHANIHSPQGALDIAGITPGKYAFAEKKPEPIGPAEATVSSVKGIVDLMKQATETAALLPKEEAAPESPASPLPIVASVPITDVDIALNVACRLPKFKTAQQGNILSLLKSQQLYWPTEGLIYSTFNASRGKGRRHGAIDIVAAKGTPIAAAADGIVSVVANGGKGFSGYGRVVVIDHGSGVHTLYSHCDTTIVKMGQRVKQGEFIATVGRTGRATTNLLHFEVRVAGKKKDPLAHLPSRPEMVKAHNYKTPKKSSN